jgi:hypothetical protein
LPVEFKGFPKLHRLSRPCIVTEKIDGTNAQVYITEDGRVLAGCRTRWLTLEADNYGFARWVEDHKEELLLLGPGRHFGEWWGQGVQRNYGLTEKRFSLFNVQRWTETPPPECCHVVPIVRAGDFSQPLVWLDAMGFLQEKGSLAAPGFMHPEGIVVYHIQGNVAFKKTFEKDQEGKGQ